MAEGDNGGEGGAGEGGGEGGEGGSSNSGPDLKAVMDGLGALTESVKGLQTNQATLQTSMEELQAGGEGDAGGDGGSGGDGGGGSSDASSLTSVSDYDLERMTRKDYANLIVGAISGDIKKQIEELGTNVKQVATKVETGEVGVLVKAAADAHKDFWDFKEEMMSVVKASPGLTPEDAYTLARAKNPEKAAEMDKKHTDAGDAGKGGEAPKGQMKLDPFGGLTPTSGYKSSGDQKLKPNEAANKAFEDIFETG